MCSTKTIHRLVLNAFENNCENKAFVDHIDNNPLNNCLFNLHLLVQEQKISIIKLSIKQIHQEYFGTIKIKNAVRP